MQCGRGPCPPEADSLWRGINEVNTQNENIIPSFSKCLKEKNGLLWEGNKSPS